jgi:hypothetical protein
MPAIGMVGHGVIEHAIHIKEHGFGVESLKAVFLCVLFDFFIEHIF